MSETKRIFGLLATGGGAGWLSYLLAAGNHDGASITVVICAALVMITCFGKAK
jgi:hypothetical protein